MSTLRFADVAITPLAPEFQGLYRNNPTPYHTPDFPAVLDRAAESGVKHILLTCMSLRDVDALISTCSTQAQDQALTCSMTLGVHPYNAQEPHTEAPNYLGVMKGRIRELLALGPNSPLKAYGELGLDFDRTEKASREIQIWAFKAQLDLIVEEQWDLPLFLHCRNAVREFVDVLTPYLPKLARRSGLVHSFVGSTEEMKELVALGLDVSVNGFSFQDEQSREMVKAIPLDRLQIETDSPWGFINANGELAKKFPVPQGVVAHQSKKRDKFEMGKMVKERNESCLIAQVAAIVAGLKGAGSEEVAEAAYQNSVKMFGLG